MFLILFSICTKKAYTKLVFDGHSTSPLKLHQKTWECGG
jgi:hypothetical protein